MQEVSPFPDLPDFGLIGTTEIFVLRVAGLLAQAFWHVLT